MKGKIVIAGTHVLKVTWNSAEMLVSEGNKVLYSGIPFTDILDYEDVVIDTTGNAIFIVRRNTLTEVASGYNSDNYEPKMKYPFKTQVEVLEQRAISAFVKFV